MAQKLFDKFLGSLICHKLRKLKLIPHDLLINFISVVSCIAKGEIPTHKLVHHDAQWPKISHVVVAFAQDDIGGHVVRGAYYSVSLPYWFTLLGHFLSNCHIDQFEIPIKINHKVLRLDISGNDRIFKQILQDGDDTSGVELPISWGKKPDFLHHFIKIFPLHKLHELVGILRGMEGTT
jgi:hypothetical protein